jgi:HK97 family phage portal protein
MAIWNSVQGVWSRIAGGWRTYGPGVPAGTIGAFADDGMGNLFESASDANVQRLSAVWACMSLRAETQGTLPCHMRDSKKKVARTHPLYAILHDSPNAMMTAAEYWSLVAAHEDMYGNHISIVQRRVRDRSVISLEPYMGDAREWKLEDRDGELRYIAPGDSKPYDPRDILHFRGFTTGGYWGMSRFDVGRAVLAAQIEANTMALKSFKQGLKIGGFFKVEQNLTLEQREEWENVLRKFGSSANAGKWMTLLKGMTPVGGAEYRPKASDAELLASRVFGVEEVCRLFNTPPPLIGHADKASSWASSLEQLNLMFLMYSVQPNLIRRERRIEKVLLTGDDRARGAEVKFSVAGLLRSDLKTRQAFYASALQNGHMSINEVRDLEDRPGIGAEGDAYRVQMQMVDVDKIPEQNTDKQDEE